MSDTAPDPWDNEPEFVWAAHENPDILPARINKASLDPEVEGGFGSVGWYQVDDAMAARLDAEELAAQGAVVTESPPEPVVPPEPEPEPVPDAIPDAADFAPGK